MKDNDNSKHRAKYIGVSNNFIIYCQNKAADKANGHTLCYAVTNFAPPEIKKKTDSSQAHTAAV